MSNGTCIICYENARYTVKTYLKKRVKCCSCNYYIHEHCLSEWIKYKNGCPICKCEIDEKPKHIRNVVSMCITNIKITVCLISICVGLAFAISTLMAVFLVVLKIIMRTLLIRNYV